MTVTLNFTSKGLIDAIQRQLAQQKSEGKISGDISYSKIATCSFWDAIDIINKKHKAEKKSLVFHGKGYTCDNKEQNTDWAKSVVVYGNVTLDDNEWKTLVEAMGLELTSKETKEESKAEEKPVVEKEQVTPVEEEEFKMEFTTQAALMSKLESYGNNIARVVEITKKILLCKVELTEEGHIKIFQKNNELPWGKYLELVNAQLAKEGKEIPETNIIVNTETPAEENSPEENCSEEDCVDEEL